MLLCHYYANALREKKKRKTTIIETKRKKKIGDGDRIHIIFFPNKYGRLTVKTATTGKKKEEYIINFKVRSMKKLCISGLPQVASNVVGVGLTYNQEGGQLPLNISVNYYLKNAIRIN